MTIISFRTYKQFFWLGLALAITVSYNACGKFNTEESIAPLGYVDCDANFKAAFDNSYHPIFKANCTGCHSKASVAAPGNFADGDLLEGLKAMYEEEYGYPDRLALVNKNALDLAHPAQNSGPQLKVEIDNATAVWEKGLQEFNDCIGIPNPIKPRTKPVGVVSNLQPPNSNTYTTIELNLQSAADLEKGDDLEGAKFIFDMLFEGEEITGAACTPELQSPDGKCYSSVTAYKITNPRITTGEDALLVEKIDLFFNGIFSGTQTTFRNINIEIPANSTNFALLPVGSSPLLLQPDDAKGFNPGTDTISFEFKELKIKPEEPTPTPTPTP